VTAPIFLSYYLCRERTIEMERDIERQRQLDLERAKSRELQYNLEMEREKQTQVHMASLLFETLISYPCCNRCLPPTHDPSSQKE
jgi:hypothetical protein